MIPHGTKRVFKFPWRSRAAVRADIREEFQFHLDMRTAELVAGGPHPKPTLEPRPGASSATRRSGPRRARGSTPASNGASAPAPSWPI